MLQRKEAHALCAELPLFSPTGPPEVGASFEFSPEGFFFRLGILLGAKLWHDFSSENDWDTKFAGLVKEISGHLKVTPPLQPAQASPLASAPNLVSYAC